MLKSIEKLETPVTMITGFEYFSDKEMAVAMRQNLILHACMPHVAYRAINYKLPKQLNTK